MHLRTLRHGVEDAKHCAGAHSVRATAADARAAPLTVLFGARNEAQLDQRLPALDLRDPGARTEPRGKVGASIAARGAKPHLAVDARLRERLGVLAGDGVQSEAGVVGAQARCARGLGQPRNAPAPRRNEHAVP